MQMFKALWQYRNFVATSVRNEFKTRFSRSTLGGLWAILNPLAQVAIYALILSNVLSARLSGIEGKYSFTIYLCAGTLGWNLFVEIVSKSVHMFTSQGNLLKKVMFPKVVLPATIVCVTLLDNLMLFCATLGVFILLGHLPDFAMIWTPLLMLITAGLGIGVGLIIGVLNVFIRDVSHVVPIILQILFWFTPIVYPENAIPAAYRHLLRYNPMYPVIRCFQDILAFNRPPHPEHLLITCAVSLVLMVIGFLLFMRANEEMVDVL